MTTVAAVDCGTNSTRLLVARPAGASSGSSAAVGLEPVERLMTITRLGAGVDASGRLAPESIDRTVDVLRRYRDVLELHGAERVRASATSAVRDAANGDDFLDAAASALGARPEVLDGLEEGRLSFAGATAELEPSRGPFLVVDIGGGSTELVLGTTEVEAVASIDVGCVRLTEQYLHHDPPAPEELSSAISVTQAWLEEVVRDHPAMKGARSLVGLAGTVTTVAAVEIGLPEYDRDRIHHFVLTRAAVEDVFRTLATESRADRIFNPGLEEARADVIVGGCCALVAVMRFFGFDDMLVSEADILDGLARTLLP